MKEWKWPKKKSILSKLKKQKNKVRSISLMFSHFFQFSCVHCKRSIHLGRNGLCSRCQKQIKAFPYCGRCGSPLQHYVMVCGHCLRNEPAWDRIVIIGHYLEPLSSLIHRLKFQKQFWLDRSLSRLLYLAVR